MKSKPRKQRPSLEHVGEHVKLTCSRWPCMAGKPIIEYIATNAGTRLPYTAAMLQRRRERLNAESQALFEAL